jgi:CheY-like chemotaxis protein
MTHDIIAKQHGRTIQVQTEPGAFTAFIVTLPRAFNMEFALSAPAALERVKAIPDLSLILILSDINMPGMKGLEMLPKVKAERPNVPVIMITACGDEATQKRANELGAAGLLPKPIDFSLLRQEIDRRLERAA